MSNFKPRQTKLPPKPTGDDATAVTPWRSVKELVRRILDSEDTAAEHDISYQVDQFKSIPKQFARKVYRTASASGQTEYNASPGGLAFFRKVLVLSQLLAAKVVAQVLKHEHQRDSKWVRLLCDDDMFVHV